MAATYEAIATTTMSSSATSVTLSSIPSTYTDIVAVVVSSFTSTTNGPDFRMRFNSDSGSNYSIQNFVGDGSTTFAAYRTNSTEMVISNNGTGTLFTCIVNVMNYANTNKYKSAVADYGTYSSSAEQAVGCWRSTAAINSITFLTTSGPSLSAGSTITLYGIKAA